MGLDPFQCTDPQLVIIIIEKMASYPPHLTLPLIASMVYANFDVLIQGWTPSWGSGRMLPVTFWFVGGLSLAMVPWIDWLNVKVLAARLAGAGLLTGAVVLAVLNR